MIFYFTEDYNSLLYRGSSYVVRPTAGAVRRLKEAGSWGLD